MNVSLVYKNVESLEFNSIEEGEIEQDKELKLIIGARLFENELDKCLVKFRYSVKLTIKDLLSADLIYEFTFKFDEEISKGFDKSDEARKIVPSIAYPYIKSYLETVITLSGYKNIGLPYINFFDDPIESD